MGNQRLANQAAPMLEEPWASTFKWKHSGQNFGERRRIVFGVWVFGRSLKGEGAPCLGGDARHLGRVSSWGLILKL